MNNVPCGVSLLIAVFTSTGWAMPIIQFNRMADNDEIRYVNSLTDSAEEACRGNPALYAQVKTFFRAKQPGEDISGMGKFELNMAYALVAALQPSATDPKAHQLEVEDVFYMTLLKNGIDLPNHPKVSNFSPREPLRPPITMAAAQKGLAQTQAWVARTVPHDSPAMFSGYPTSGQAIAAFIAFIIAYSAAHPDSAANASSAPTGVGEDADSRRQREREIEENHKLFLRASGCNSDGSCPMTGPFRKADGSWKR